MSFVAVAVARPVHGLFTYRQPEGVSLESGHVVQVPFGRQKVTGYVIEQQDTCALKNIKTVARLLDPVPAFDATQLRFFQWISEYYLSGLGEVISTALPSGYKAKIRRVYMPTDAGIEALASEDLPADVPFAIALREVVAKPGRTRGGIERLLHQELDTETTRRALEQLVDVDVVSFDKTGTLTEGHPSVVHFAIFL